MPDIKNWFRRLSEAMAMQADSPEVLFASLPVLQTDRLLLRPMTMRDAKDIFEYSSSEEVTRYVLWEPHRSIAESKEYLRFMLRQYREGQPSSYGIVLKESGKVIGTIGYMWYSPEHRSAEIGYSLAADQWNKGLATEALRAVIAMTFDRMKLHRIECIHDVANPASGRVMQKCGMTFEGNQRQKIFNKDRFVDVALYAILESDPRT